MNSQVFKNIISFLIVVLLQIIIFKRIDLTFGSFDFIHFLIYPIFIIILPLKTPRALVISLGFILGITVDMFYDSPGIHASACVFIGFIRPYVLKALEPYEGYKIDHSPSLKNMGFVWFLPYCSIMMGIFMLFYFSVEAFSFVYYFEIFMRSIFSFFASMMIILIYQLISGARS